MPLSSLNNTDNYDLFQIIDNGKLSFQSPSDSAVITALALSEDGQVRTTTTTAGVII